jgi:hypothetical protein
MLACSQAVVQAVFVRPRANGIAGTRPGRPGRNGPVAAQPRGGRTRRCIRPDRAARRRESWPVPRRAWCRANTGWSPVSLRTPPPVATVACQVPVSRAPESSSSLARGHWIHGPGCAADRRGRPSGNDVMTTTRSGQDHVLFQARATCQRVIRIAAGTFAQQDEYMAPTRHGLSGSGRPVPLSP